MENKKKIFIGITIVLVIVFIVVMALEMKKDNKQESQTTAPQTTTIGQETTTKDGMEIKTNPSDDGFGELIPLDPVKK